MPRQVEMFFREGTKQSMSFKVTDADQVATAFAQHTQTGSPAYLELTPVATYPDRPAVVRLASVHLMLFRNVPNVVPARRKRSKR